MSQKFKLFFQKIYRIGFTHIFTASVINKLLSLAVNMIIVRFLTKSEYGLYSYAYNIVTIVLIVSDLGTRMARFQFCCETKDSNEREAIYIFLNRIGTISNLLFSIGTFIYATFLPLSIPAGKIALQSLSFVYLFQYYYDNACYGLRIEKENKKYALLTNINSFFYLVLVCAGAFFFGIIGTAAGRYLSFLVPIIVFWIWHKKYNSSTSKYSLSKEKKVRMIKYGLLIVLTNSVSSILSYFDTYLVGRIISDELILADYKIATVIPHALAFIPTSLITMIYPYYVEKANNPRWILKTTFKIQLFMGIASLLISIFCFFAAPVIIDIVFGKQYETAVPVFRVLSLTFFISATFRLLYGNILSMLHLVKVNFVLSSIECVVNIIADVLLIQEYGSIGAAYATLIITVFSSIMSGVYLIAYLKRKRVNETAS